MDQRIRTFAHLPCLARSEICPLRLAQLGWIYREQMGVGHICEVKGDDPIRMTPSQILRHRGADIPAGDEETVIAVSRHQFGNGVRHPDRRPTARRPLGEAVARKGRHNPVEAVEQR